MKIGNIEVYGIIYKVTNLKNGKVYIGQTIREDGFNGRYSGKGQGIERIYGDYLSAKKGGYYYNKHLVKSIEKYGFDAFEVNELFDVAFSQEELDIKEKIWISLYKATDNRCGYNLQEGGIDAFGNWVENPKSKEYMIETRIINRIVRDKTILSKYNKEDLMYNHHSEIDNKRRRRKIICLTTGKDFDSITLGAKFYHISTGRVGACLEENRERKTYSAGRDNAGKPLIWMYYEDYIDASLDEIFKRMKKGGLINKNREITYNLEKVMKIKQKKEVYHILTGNIYESVKIASLVTHSSENIIKHQCKNGTKRGEREWMYYEEYLKEQNKKDKDIA